jgi:hypothetical protein
MVPPVTDAEKATRRQKIKLVFDSTHAKSVRPISYSVNLS